MEDLERFYQLIDRLDDQLGGKHELPECDGYMDCPDRGVYFFFVPDEHRSTGNHLRITRVGTHAVSSGSGTTLWNRLRTHRGALSGTYEGGGNHQPPRLGLDPVVRESGGTRKEGSISKKGNAALRWILVQCANVAVGRADDPYLGRFYSRLKRRKNHQVAIVATARKMLVSIFHMLDRREVYDPPGVSA